MIKLLIVIIANVKKHHTIMLLCKSTYCSYVNINVIAVKAVSIFCVQSSCTSQITKTNLLVAWSSSRHEWIITFYIGALYVKYDCVLYYIVFLGTLENNSHALLIGDMNKRFIQQFELKITITITTFCVLVHKLPKTFLMFKLVYCRNK